LKKPIIYLTGVPVDMCRDYDLASKTVQLIWDGKAMQGRKGLEQGFGCDFKPVHL